jgi:DNA (cytosine-5)-methyltransferase 1
MNYYNDFDKKACAWLRELIKAGLIPDGVVDERSITDVTADDLCGFTQCHFFAGIGGWSRALQIAGWGEDRPVWTGSCPCQPFSTAGKQAGKSDERHLWPAFAKLIAECKPPVVFGEQVEGAIKHGWIDDLQADLEREDYAVGFAVLGAHSLGAPHIRQRLYWVANADGAGWEGRLFGREDTEREIQHQRAECNCSAFRLANAELHGHPAAENRGSIRKKQEEGGLLQSEGACDADRLANTDGNGLQPWKGNNSTTGHGDTIAAASCNDRQGSTCQTDSIWATTDWLFCRDGKWRPVESGTFPLADGIPGRVGLLRGYGNAIVPQVAAEFIRAFMEVE